MRKVSERAFDNSLRYLARGKLTTARIRMEAVLEEEGLLAEEASHLSRGVLRTWARWFMQRNRRR